MIRPRYKDRNVRAKVVYEISLGFYQRLEMRNITILNPRPCESSSTMRHVIWVLRPGRQSLVDARILFETVRRVLRQNDVGLRLSQTFQCLRQGPVERAVESEGLRTPLLKNLSTAPLSVEELENSPGAMPLNGFDYTRKSARGVDFELCARKARKIEDTYYCSAACTEYCGFFSAGTFTICTVGGS